ncbi:DUF882 domain-containing protein [Vibrio sp. S9_S30]|uniref:DUF882 domain-containing protein n=1 Tax=Vibrio sp. S9_S30 TaxID=2720226 RepID=UPI00168135DA|nr:DUF882 domain-containing protein [Vibrio sp. S9_S30]MBD1558330.1 DUF882 domain-containing protein [Vibrio sp. S9_S30]
MTIRELTRRDFLCRTALVTAAVTLPFSPTVLATYANRPRTLLLNNLHTGELLESCYFDGKKYVSNEMAQINRLCRDHRRNEVHTMDRALFDQINAIQNIIGSKAEVQIISGYRSPTTNETLREKSKSVAKKSYHMQGRALDFRLDGVRLSEVRRAAMSLKVGGVGYYPKSNFIHIDTGPVRAW